jgi:hypothetical protein
MPPAKPTHGMEIGTTRGSFNMTMSEFSQEIPGQLAAGLNALGKDGGFDDVDLSFEIFPLPPGARNADVVRGEYIQAGGTAQRLTVEIRRIDADGQPRQYTVGHPAAADEDSESEILKFGDNAIAVRPSEVLTAAEAIPIFQHYYDHHSVPEGWYLRPISGETLAARDIAADARATAEPAGAGISKSGQPAKSRTEVAAGSASAPAEHGESSTSDSDDRGEGRLYL